MACEKLVVEREMDQFNGAAALQFPQNVGPMHVHRFVAQCQRKGDGFDAFPLHQQVENFPLARREHVEHGRDGLTAAQGFDRIGAEIVPAHAD